MSTSGNGHLELTAKDLKSQSRRDADGVPMFSAPIDLHPPLAEAE